MEISKMLTISTAHISPETAQFLDKETIEGKTSLVVYNKGEYGWFIFIAPDFEAECIPEDLQNCMCFAEGNGCEWLCLDRDGEIIAELKEYTWS